jgi:hypothetical protein
MSTKPLLLTLSCVTALARSEVLWDNYSGSTGYDGYQQLSSERNPTVPDSWTVDDALFAQPSRITRIRWIASLYIAPQRHLCDILVLRRTDEGAFEIVRQFDDLEFTKRHILYTFGGEEHYEGSVTLPGAGLELEPGHYYCGARQVGTDGRARNFHLTAGKGVIKGKTMGYFKAPIFGYPEWTPVDQPFKGYATDFAFRLEGEIIPEPATAALALVLAAAARKR